MQCRGIRGAITVPKNDKESVLTAAKELLVQMTQANGVDVDDIAAIFFTTTSDLNVEFPAAATRELGWSPNLALLCGHEMNVPHDLPRCLRVLMLTNTDKRPDEIAHIYLGEAKRLRTRPSPPDGGNA